MGYSTYFTGSLELSRELFAREKDYINNFSRTRRMKRDVDVLMEMYDGKYGHPTPKTNTPEDIYGVDGEYFVRDERDKSILDFNMPPGQLSSDDEPDFNKRWDINQERIKYGVCQPGLWCQWIINEDNELEWDGGEKFHYYTEWLKYLIRHFFEPWGIKLNGEIEWKGDDPDDIGIIRVKDNVVEEKTGRIVYD